MDIRVFEETKVQPAAGFVHAGIGPSSPLPINALRCQSLNNSQDSIADFFDDVLNGNTPESIVEIK